MDDRKGWSKLAAAIIRSGERAQDNHFLESDWCANLRELVKLAENNCACTDMIDTSKTVHKVSEGNKE